MEKKDTRLDLLQTAINHFVAYGFDGARMDNIAKESGYNKATYYYYFKNKENLYYETLKFLFDKINNALETLDLNLDPILKLKNYTDILTSILLDNPNSARLMLKELSSGGTNIINNLFEIMSKFISIFENILLEGIQQGVFKESPVILVHFNVVGTIVLYIASENFRDKITKIKGSNMYTGKLEKENISNYIFDSVMGAIAF